MMTIICVAVAIIFGLLMFSQLQESIPDELSFLRSGSPPVATAPGSKVFLYKGWGITQTGAATELTKEFAGPLIVDANSYSAPVVGILCNDNKLDIRIDVQEPTTGTQTTEVAVEGIPAQLWQKGKNQNIFPRDPSVFLRQMAQAGAAGLSVSVSYKNIGVQSSRLDTAGLAELVKQLPANCRP